MPDPLLMSNGDPVRTAADWARRREEIRDLLLSLQYGRIPAGPAQVAPDAEPVAEESSMLAPQAPIEDLNGGVGDRPDALHSVLSPHPSVLPFTEEQHGGATRFRRLQLKMGPRQQVAMMLELYLPVDRTGPCPTIVRIGLGCPIIPEINRRGYAFAAFEHRDLDPETEGYDVEGSAQQAYPDYDWGSIAVWAWGASRALDYLRTLPEIDPERTIVTGHSRTGKAALLAGALDERFAVVVPNGSGCGGASCYRVSNQGAETLELITRPSRFASWFQKDFRRFAGQEDEMPFDQHFLRALVAPRALLTTDALDDLWANPLGNQAAYVASRPVFELLGAGERNAMHFRPGQHDQLAEDFRVLLDFADACFAGRVRAADFTMLPYPQE